MTNLGHAFRILSWEGVSLEKIWGYSKYSVEYELPMYCCLQNTQCSPEMRNQGDLEEE